MALAAGWNSALLWASWYEPPHEAIVRLLSWAAAVPAARAAAATVASIVFAIGILMMFPCLRPRSSAGRCRRRRYLPCGGGDFPPPVFVVARRYAARAPRAQSRSSRQR